MNKNPLLQRKNQGKRRLPSYTSYLKRVYDWKEEEHPREPKGTSEGGQFASAGGTVNAYHGTNSENIAKFNLGHAGSSHGSEYGLGFYFTTNHNEATMFGKNVKEYKLHTKRLVNPEHSSDITPEQLSEIAKRFGDVYIKTPEGKRGAEDIIKELNSTPYARSYKEVIDAYLLDLGMYGDADEEMGLDEYRQKVYEIITAVTNINGYEIPRENDEFWYAMFNPDDIEEVK